MEHYDLKLASMQHTLAHILKYPVLPVFYHDDKQTCIDVVQACYDGGIRVFEFVSRGPKALENFKALLDYRDEYLSGLLLGIGTIKNKESAQRYVSLGADFIVSPVVKAEIASVTLTHGVLWIPGCMTPTEISLAEDLGAPLVKLFPGDTLGQGFLKAIKPLFPDMLFMPTGGVNPDEESIRTWFAAGVSAVGMGSKLFSKPENAVGYDWLVDRSQALIAWATS